MKQENKRSQELLRQKAVEIARKKRLDQEKEERDKKEAIKQAVEEWER